MNISRELQNQILTELGEVYPRIGKPSCLEKVDLKIQDANLFYLFEHGLIHATVFDKNMNGSIKICELKISHRGIDFLADDGGLSAILGTVTVRFADSELRSLLESNLTKSNESPDEKKRLLEKLRELPSESIKHLTLKLLDLGLENAPSAIEIIKSFIQSVG